MNTLTLSDSSLPTRCLANQIILITGVTQGIGRALALATAQQGATVILVGKSVKILEALYDEILAAQCPEPAIHPLNLLHLDPVKAYELAQSIKQLFGRLDAIVHNAGIFGQITPLEHLSPEKWQEVIHLNLNIPYLLTHALLPLIRETPYASILFTVAEEALKAKAYWSAYAASKSGIKGLAQALHEELELNSTVRVNCVNPGKVRTRFRQLSYPGIDLLSVPTPESIMPFYLYLLSREAKDIRGKWVELPSTLKV